MAEPIRVLFFAGARERTGLEFITVDATEVASVHDVRRYLLKRFGNLATWLPKIAIAVNEEYADDATVLQPGDTVAVIPPVSGG
jgi:molybdopterin converting factor subunit 1